MERFKHDDTKLNGKPAKITCLKINGFDEWRNLKGIGIDKFTKCYFSEYLKNLVPVFILIFYISSNICHNMKFKNSSL